MWTTADQKTFTYFGVVELEGVSVVFACNRKTPYTNNQSNFRSGCFALHADERAGSVHVCMCLHGHVCVHVNSPLRAVPISWSSICLI